MALKKYKICPVCGTHNAPNFLECKQCETDLTSIKPVDDTVDTAPVQQDNAASTTQDALVRICECGHHNAPQARKCEKCHEDISDILLWFQRTLAQKALRPAYTETQHRQADQGKACHNSDIL